VPRLMAAPVQAACAETSVCPPWCREDHWYTVVQCQLHAAISRVANEYVSVWEQQAERDEHGGAYVARHVGQFGGATGQCDHEDVSPASASIVGSISRRSPYWLRFPGHHDYRVSGGYFLPPVRQWTDLPTIHR